MECRSNSLRLGYSGSTMVRDGFEFGTFENSLKPLPKLFCNRVERVQQQTEKLCRNLTIAVVQDDMEMIRILLENGADARELGEGISAADGPTASRGGIEIGGYCITLQEGARPSRVYIRSCGVDRRGPTHPRAGSLFILDYGGEGYGHVYTPIRPCTPCAE
jgi:hypothetical protein